VSFRLGEGLGDETALHGCGLHLPARVFFKDVDGFSRHVFGGVASRAVARDLFAEGNTFKDSPGLKLVPFQLDLQAGGAIHIGRSAALLTKAFMCYRVAPHPSLQS